MNVKIDIKNKMFLNKFDLKWNKINDYIWNEVRITLILGVKKNLKTFTKIRLISKKIKYLNIIFKRLKYYIIKYLYIILQNIYIV